MIRTRTCAYQKVRNISFRNIWVRSKWIIANLGFPNVVQIISLDLFSPGKLTNHFAKDKSNPDKSKTEAFYGNRQNKVFRY